MVKPKVRSKKEGQSDSEESRDSRTELRTSEELKGVLLNIRDKMSDGTGAPVYSLSAVNYLLNLPNVYELLNDENKELARDIWLRLKSAGIQLKSPVLLFDEEEAASA